MVPLSSFFFFFLFSFGLLATANTLELHFFFLFFFFWSDQQMQSRFQSAAVTSLVLAFEPDAEHERLSPCNVGRLLGFHFVRNGRPRSNHPENGRSPVEGKNFASALAKCFFFFFFFFFFSARSDTSFEKTLGE